MVASVQLQVQQCHDADPRIHLPDGSGQQITAHPGSQKQEKPLGVDRTTRFTEIKGSLPFGC